MKRLLVLAREFAPSAAIGGQRSLRLVRRIRAFGWDPYVLTAPAGCQLSADPSMGRDVLSTLPIRAVPCWSLWRHARYRPLPSGAWRRCSYVMHKALARLTYPLVPVDPEYPWAVAATSVGVSMVRQQQIDLIWATNPLGCHCLARRIWHRTGVPYVLDFRDVRRIDHTAAMSSRDRSNVRVERDVLWDAAGVTYVSPPQVDTLIEKHSFVADKPACLVYNWFEADEIAACSPQPFEQPTILHGGSLYGGARRLEGVLAGLSVLRQRRAAQDGTIHLVQYATESRVGFLARPVADYDLQQVVHIRPSLPRSQFLSACRGAAILLLVVGHDKGVVQHAGAIPGKLYDYFAACRPVLVVGPRDCEAGKMVRRLNRGLAVPDDAPEKIAEAIELLLQGRGDAGRLDLTHEAVREFEAARAVEKMARFLSKVCEG